MPSCLNTVACSAIFATSERASGETGPPAPPLRGLAMIVSQFRSEAIVLQRPKANRPFAVVANGRLATFKVSGQCFEASWGFSPAAPTGRRCQGQDGCDAGP